MQTQMQSIIKVVAEASFLDSVMYSHLKKDKMEKP